MPGMNLTRDEATARGALIDVTAYDVDLDLTQATEDGATTFGSTSTITFTCAEPGAETWLDLVDATIEEITLNGAPIDPATAYADSRIALPGLAAENTVVVRAACTYSRSGEGLHRFVDPADDRVYLYSQFEVPDARRVYACFEQPDLKSVFTFTVTAPAHWKVVSNAPTPAPVPVDGDPASAVWAFPTTQRMSTYITAIVAGDYVEFQDVYEGPNGSIPLGHYARHSLAAEMERDLDEIVGLTKQGFAFFEDAFGVPYPFEKYDQLYVPEYNSGAMENAGCVTFRDEYLPRSRQPRSFYEYRASVILHEMAHMWFGNLVTMKWWDDLWLNESFAEWACYHAEALATEYTDAWTGFANMRKQTGYRADQLPSTHPIAADMVDLHAVETNFDMITYAKGASVLKQLVAWVGIEPFLAGLGQYFRDHAYDNTEFSDLLSALEKASGRELTGWAKEWLQTAGVNTVRPVFELTETADGEPTYASFAIRQTAAESHPTLRRHRIGIGAYRHDDGKLVRDSYVEVDIEGELTEIPALVGQTQPDLLLLNDGDLTFAKVRLDERSLATAVEHLSDMDDSLARALVWSAAWDMTRDAEMSATDFVDLVLGNIGAETDSWGVTAFPRFAAQAVGFYSAPQNRAALSQRWEEGLRGLLADAGAGTDHQLTFARAYAGAAHSEAAIADLEALLDGSLTFEGLTVDQDLRWVLLNNLARLGRADDARIDTELAGDNTNTALEKAAAARAAQPRAEAKDRAWQAAMVDGATPNETGREIAFSFWRGGQEEVLAEYVERYLSDAPHAWERIGSHRAAVAVEHLFPRVLATPATLKRVEAWLAEESEGVNSGARRYIDEGRADLARALAAQERDARG
ncbi:aminopeptidase N [Nocardioides sp. GY 10113]|uniref:aminopeptidase N n=1 Tax=Nocardioides sp. GY 10113 TaxID=2569761 RepID=UPI0010A807CD|nr:aminopeptidase N [Nocardioides sp. GY 10113]TIC87432.1 aminopeptidase N [Nocardioides sp. GY 10113]